MKLWENLKQVSAALSTLFSIVGIPVLIYLVLRSPSAVATPSPPVGVTSWLSEAADFTLKALFPILLAVIVFWIKDVWWENRKRQYEHERAKLVECIAPLYVRCISHPDDLFSGTFAANHLRPIVETKGHLLSSREIDVFIDLMLAESNLLESLANVKAAGPEYQTIMDQLLLALKAGIPFEKYMDKLRPEERENTIKSMMAVGDLATKVPKLRTEYAENLKLFLKLVTDDFNQLASLLQRSKGAIPYSLPKVIQSDPRDKEATVQPMN